MGRRGVCCMENNRFKDSIASFETLIGLDREWPNILDWLLRAHAADRRDEKSGGAGNGGGGGAAYPDMDERRPKGNWAEAATEKDLAKCRNHYEVLGVTQDATDKQVKKAYR